MKLNLLNLTTMVVVVALFSACGGGEKKTEEASSASSEFDAAKEKVAVDFKKVLEDVPPPSEIPYLLMQAGADFDASLVNSTDNVANYQGDITKSALNLGVYSSDIAYLASYGDSEVALDFMGECQKLAGTIGISDVIDYGMVARFERNMENKDSLAVIVNDIMQKSSEKLGELDQLNGFALLLAGSYIEGLYLTNEIISNYPDDLPEDLRNSLLTPLVKIVLDQKQSLNDLLKVMNDIPESDEVNTAIADLEKIKAIYDGELVDVENAIAENTGDFVLKPSAIANLAKVVGEIRGKIVG